MTEYEMRFSDCSSDVCASYLSICTSFNMLIPAGEIGSGGAKPVSGPAGEALNPGSVERAHACAAIQEAAVVCSKEALAWTLREIGWTQIGNLIGLAAGLSLPSVILMMMYGQTSIFFVWSREGLLPAAFGKVLTNFYNIVHAWWREDVWN